MEKLPQRLGLSPDTLQSIFHSGRFADTIIVCDDGTSFPVNKLIVCSNSKVLDAAMNGAFVEAQDRVYRLHEKDSSVVKLFLSIIHGMAYVQHPWNSQTRQERQQAVLRFAKVYCLADELQADGVFYYSLKVIQSIVGDCPCREVINLREAIFFVEKNAGRTRPFWKILIEHYFVGTYGLYRIHFSEDPIDPKFPFVGNECYNYMMKDPKNRIQYVEYVCRNNVADNATLERYRGDEDFHDLIQKTDIGHAILEAWFEGVPIDMQNLSKDERFVSALRGSKLASKMLFDVLSDQYRPGLDVAPKLSYCAYCRKETVLRNLPREVYYLEDGEEKQVDIAIDHMDALSRPA